MQHRVSGDIDDLLRRAERISLFAGVLSDDIGQAYLRLLKTLCEGDSEQAALAYPQLFRALCAEWADELDGGSTDLWQAHLAERVLLDRNAFTLQAEKRTFEVISKPLALQAARDLETLRGLAELTGDRLAALVEEVTGEPAISFAGLTRELAPAAAGLAGRTDWRAATEYVAEAIKKSGVGAFGRYRACRWNPQAKRVEGIADPDTIGLDQLWGYEWQQEELLRNTQKLLHGLPANNALLYGDRGTGKSSTVKAIMNALADEGLRLVEVQKEHLADFPLIMRILRPRAQKFILFIDDLSFEEDDANFKALKAVLEGGIETRPDNVVLYATSNRRNLVRERFSERQYDPDDEVHPMDSYEEKLSLADRFGLRLPYPAPDQEGYLTIVLNLAEQEGLHMPKDQIVEQALQWHEGRNGRAARQFVNWLAGELGMAGSGR